MPPIVGDGADSGARASTASLHPITLEWFRSRFGSPSPVQKLAWPRILAGDSTLIAAPTGSGKTLAAFLCAIDRLVFGDETDAVPQGVRVLYISPVKALARDVEKNLQEPLASICALAAERGVAFRSPRVAVRSGDTPQTERQRMRRTPPEILITTPESLFLILTSGAHEMLKTVDTIIVDEIHAIVGSKRGAHLALSVERVARLTKTRLQRVGLSATSRPLDLVARYLGGTHGRKVEIVDASAKRAFDLKVESAVLDMTALPRETIETPVPTGAEGVERPWMGSGTGASGRGFGKHAEAPLQADSGSKSTPRGAPTIWPAIHARALALIREHRSTIVFVNARRVAERVAAAINELAAEEICRAHHGSLAREEREIVENALKDGALRAVVATSSLELGIDMGLVDLVIQIETPPSVASTIQRVGRASHHLGGVPKALIFPVYRGDLLAAAATVDALGRGEIEPVTLPRNPLDVLAQQILSILVEREMDVDALFALVRRAASYSDLPRSSFDGVLDMLAGRYPSHDFRDLRPRIVWNRETGTVRARTGVRLSLFANAGTIPDRGLFGVFLAGSRNQDGTTKQPSRRVGELDEEMVFESRVGDIVMLGASSWRIDAIERERVLVAPAPGLRGRMPFWKADRPARPVENAKRIGALARKVLTLGRDRASAELRDDYALDAPAAANLVSYVFDQKDRGAVPTDRAVVLERMKDEMGDLRLCVLSCFGGRVHQPLALAITRKLRRSGAEVEAMVSDDGIVLRVPDRETAPALRDLLPASHELEALVREELSDSSLFAARFREAAGRSLLLPRRRPGSRSPLWAQRQKAHALLETAARFPSFPLILEAYRECLSDDFDIAATIDLLASIEKKGIQAVTVDVEHPSPYASALLFGYVATVMYAEDAPLAERRAHALAIAETQLQALLGATAFPDLLDPAAIEEAHAERQCLSAERRVRTLDGLHETLLRIGDLSLVEIAERAETDAVAGFAETLLAEKRAFLVRVGQEPRLIAVEDAGLYRDGTGTALPPGVPREFLLPVDEPRRSLVSRYARTRGPFTTGAVAERFGFTRDDAERELQALESDGEILRGPFTKNATDTEWCGAEVLKRIRQRSLARARGEVSPVSGRDYARFLVAWHGLDSRAQEGLDRVETLLAAIEQLQGAAVPASALEPDILGSRVPDYRPQDLDVLVARGDVVIEGRGPLGNRDGKVALFLASQRALLSSSVRTPSEGDVEARVRAVLAERGALFFPDIERSCPGVRRNDILDALWVLFWNGEVTNDSVAAVRARTVDLVPATAQRRAFASRMSRYRSRLDVPRDAVGRFSLLPRHATELVEAQLAALDQWIVRHGVLTREAITSEAKEGGFSAVYPLLRALEDRGQVRRGYFIEGLGALQFADPAALESLRDLRQIPPGDEVGVVLAATDPANPYGVALPWPEWSRTVAERRARHHIVLADGVLVAFLSNDGARVVGQVGDEGDAGALARIAGAAIAAWMRRRGIRIIGHDETAVEPLNQGSLGSALRAAGLIPSGPGFRI